MTDINDLERTLKNLEELFKEDDSPEDDIDELDELSEVIDSINEIVDDGTVDVGYLMEAVKHNQAANWKEKDGVVQVKGYVEVTDSNDRSVETGSRVYTLVKNSRITNVIHIAGYGDRDGNQIKEKTLRNLLNQYGGDSEKWFHACGNAQVYDNNSRSNVDLHWFGHEGIGAVGRHIANWR